MTNILSTRLNRPLLTPRPLKIESLTGYMLRIAEANNYGSIGWIFRDVLGLPRHSHIVTPVYVAKLARDLGLDYEEVSRIAYLRDVGNPTSHLCYFGQKLHLQNTKFEHPVICPICIGENFTQGFWELKYVTCCPFHNVRLIDLCQGCGHQIGWDRARVSRCPKCDFGYVDSTYEHASPKIIELTKALYCSAKISPSILLPQSSFGMPLEQLAAESLDCFLYMLHVVRHYLVSKQLQASWRQVGSLYSSRLNYEYRLVETIGEMLTAWPNPFMYFICYRFVNNKSYLRIKSSGVLSLASTKSPHIFQHVGKAVTSVAARVKIEKSKMTFDDKFYQMVKHEYYHK